MTNEIDWLGDCLERIKGARIAIVGDFCLDAYWFIDPSEDEKSVETGLPIRRVRSQRYTPGGAGNAAANFAALGVAKVTAIGVVGRDVFGAELCRVLEERSIDTSAIYRDQPDWQTCVYSKPCIDDQEQNRLDFGAFNTPSEATVAHIIAALRAAAETHDAIIVNQQIARPLCNGPVVAAINEIARKHPALPIIVDTRDMASDFEHVSLKINAAEAARVLTGEADQGATLSLSRVRDLAAGLQKRTGRPAFITRGDRGLVVADGRDVIEIPGIAVPPPIDIVGAGDTTLAALASVLAVDRSPEAPALAARVANIASTVVIKKLHVTGTASPEEILAVGPNPDYIYHPEIASDLRAAKYVDGTEVEIVNPLPENLAIRHAIFDHDGTLSTLREGWEKIMEPMMVKAILGSAFQTASEELYERVTNECREFIDRTTGIQTLVQMQGLVELVRRFGCVPEDQILDHFGYKRIYNDQLLEMVRERVAKLDRGELAPEDFQIKNAHELLRQLHARGVTLYLASGTDVDDVIVEAKAMGYAHLFGDRIYGAVGDVNVEAKKMVLERIIRENNLSGAELMTFGDGPVEIRETRKRGGIAVGIASDEVRRFGLNPSKRKRLIRAGADVVVPDFGQLPALLSVLELSSRTPALV
ncbi:MAG: PfkB family carbohydrate kinase [Capsulimonadaceae bacterium]|nr:PfkB family carbohydrate kinase [Capsulimonadaceae bacterium]